MTIDTPERILRIGAVLERTSLSRSTLYRMMHKGSFPKPLRIAVRCAGWRESTIIEWMNKPMDPVGDDRPDKD